MTIAANLNRNDYVADGVATDFAYTFRIFAATDLQVFFDGVLKTLNTHYTVSGVGDAGGGNVTPTSLVANGVKIAIVRAVPYTQGTNYEENDPFPAETHEAALDRLTILTQQLYETLQRAVKTKLSSTFTGLELPDPVTGGELVRWKADKTNLELVGSGSLAAGVLNPIVDPGDLVQGGAGAVPEALKLSGAGKMIGQTGGLVAWRTAAQARTDLDVPSTSDVATLAIPPTLFDAKGDLLVATAADTAARKAAGADDTILQPDSAQADGLVYRSFLQLLGIATPSTPASGKGILFSPSGTPLKRPAWLDAGGQTTVLSGVLIRGAGNPFKDVVSTASETSIFSSAPTIKGNTLGTDRVLRFTLLGDILNNTGGGAGATLKVKYGATTALTVGNGTNFFSASNSATRYLWHARGEIAAAGATNAQIAALRFAIAAAGGAGVSGTAVMEGNTSAGANGSAALHNAVAEDSTADKVLDITIQPSTSSANLSIRVFSVLVELL